MLRNLSKRIGFIVIALPIGCVLIFVGGLPFLTLILLIFALAAHEYVKIFSLGGYLPARYLVIGGTLLLILTRYYNRFAHTDWLLTLLILITMTYHLVTFERGRQMAAVDFCTTLGGLLYFGWLGGYFISVQQLPDGHWWFLLAIGTTWMVDIGGYVFGKTMGKHPFCPRLSPRKTWEGYWGGFVGGVVGGLLIILLWKTIEPVSGSNLPYSLGVGLGLLLALLTPLGDLGESMVKRQFGVKDSSRIIPGHGGVWDRIDSWLWGIAIGYYVFAVFLGLG